MKHTGICIGSLLGGMVLGAAVTMLMTPHTGREMRENIREFIEKEIDKVRCKCDENGNCDCDETKR